jgi:protease-4
MERKTLFYIVAGVFIVSLFGVLAALANIDLDTESLGTATAQRIPISGTITTTGQQSLFSNAVGSQTIADKIDAANEDPNVEAVVLEINSPGGAPVASHEIVRAVDRLDKPVVAQIREAGASGAYWIASAADYVVADPVSITGSVGVVGSYLEFSGLLDDYNVSYQRFVAGEYKDLGSPFKNVSEDEEALFQEKIDLLGEYFLEDVVENRGLTPEQEARVATAQIFVGVESVEAGLVDELGGRQVTKQYLERTMNRSVKVKDAQFQRGLFSSLGQTQTWLQPVQAVRSGVTPLLT